MKNILIICATKSISPRATKKIRIAAVTQVAFAGSLVSPLPRLRNRFHPVEGKKLSALRACKVRGATRIDPRAEESVAAPKPMKTEGPHNEIRLRMN